MKKKIAVILGSKSDQEELKMGFELLCEFEIPYRFEIISAHRNPEKLTLVCKEMQKQGVSVVIACAGMAAALPGFIASLVDIPVIGVAMKGGLLDGMDAVLSMVSIPRGLGVVCSGVGKSAFVNAIITAFEILALSDKYYAGKLKGIKAKFK